MSNTFISNPAEIAAQKALEQIFESINNKKNFILEAGAGAGKTYSLVHTLRHLITIKGRELLRNNQRIACITYTNVAKDEIKSRTDNNPVILSETIHSFCWSLLSDFQSKLRSVLPKIGKWPERITENDKIGLQEIIYNFGYPKLEENQISLGHDDVLFLMIELLEERKFRDILTMRFPFILIDEYQDTDKGIFEALKHYFIASSEGPLLGFFGDHWQKIYGTGCGRIQHENLVSIEKKANFRSERKIVECLNRMRPELPQEVSDPESKGSITIYHTNKWNGQRRTESHWKGDLPELVAHKALELVRNDLKANEWDFSPEKTKILMLTHNILADEQGYRNLAKLFSRTDYYIKKEDEYIAFFVDILEPICNAFENRHYGEMFTVLDNRASIHKHSDKVKWFEDMQKLLKIRQTGTIGQIIEHIKATNRPRLPEKIDNKERRFNFLLSKSEEELLEEEKSFLEHFTTLKNIQYKEVIQLSKFINEKTPFSTKHGVKGAEFENVLVVLGRGWNQYNFGQMLEWAGSSIPSNKQDTFERNRNLFYVVCSRPKKRLALLFTQQLPLVAFKTLSNWFGKESIQELEING